MQFFDDEKCDAVEGYDGSMMAPFLTRDKEFYFFIPNLCRKMQFKFDGDTEMGGIPAYKFTVPPFYLADVKTNPDNMCYCSNPGDDGEKCFKSGVWELSKCRQGTFLLILKAWVAEAGGHCPLRNLAKSYLPYVNKFLILQSDKANVPICSLQILLPRI